MNANKKQGKSVTNASWNKHMRPFSKRAANKASRQFAKAEMK
jgi:hypothetical protein